MLQKGDKAFWKHVPPNGGYGYASNIVTVLAVRQGGRWVEIEATTKTGETRKLTVKAVNLTKAE